MYQHIVYGENNNHSEPSPAVNGASAPQLNPAIFCHACGCEFGQNINEGADNGGGGGGGGGPDHRRVLDTDTDDETDSEQGEPGAERVPLGETTTVYGDRRIHVEGHGYVSLPAIVQALRQYDVCICRMRVLPVEYELGSSRTSGIHSPNSMHVNLGSREGSMGSPSPFRRSPSSPGILHGVGSGFDAAFPPLIYFCDGALMLGVHHLDASAFGDDVNGSE